MILLLVLLACHGDLDPTVEALDQWRDGRDLLDKGKPIKAGQAFDEAMRLDPTSQALPLWKARALSQAGDTDGALACLQGVSTGPATPPELYYNRAALLARTGRRDEAMDDLRTALDMNPLWKSTARDDPDLLMLRDTPTWGALVGEEPIRGAIQGETGSSLAGTIYDLDGQMVGPEGLNLTITWNGASDLPFLPLRAIDDRFVANGNEYRNLSWSLQAVRGGRGLLGPWRVEGRTSRAFAGQIQVEPISFEILAPDGMALPADAPEDLAGIPWAPREFLQDRTAPSAFSTGGRLWVVHAPGDRVEITEAATTGPALRLEVREADQPRVLAVSWRWRDDTPSSQVKVVQTGKTVLDTIVER